MRKCIFNFLQHTVHGRCTMCCAAMHILVCPGIWKHLASSLETRRNKELIFLFYNLVFPGKIRKVFSQSLGWAGHSAVRTDN